MITQTLTHKSDADERPETGFYDSQCLIYCRQIGNGQSGVVWQFKEICINDSFCTCILPLFNAVNLQWNYQKITFQNQKPGCEAWFTSLKSEQQLEGGRTKPCKVNQKIIFHWLHTSLELFISRTEIYFFQVEFHETIRGDAAVFF